MLTFLLFAMPFVYNPYANTSNACKKHKKDCEASTKTNGTVKQPILKHHWDVTTYSRTCGPVGGNVASNFYPGPNSASITARSINLSDPPLTQQQVTPVNRRAQMSPDQTETLCSSKLSPSTEATDSDTSSDCSFDYGFNEGTTTDPAQDKGKALLSLKVMLSEQALESLVRELRAMPSVAVGN